MGNQSKPNFLSFWGNQDFWVLMIYRIHVYALNCSFPFISINILTSTWREVGLLTFPPISHLGICHDFQVKLSLQQHVFHGFYCFLLAIFPRYEWFFLALWAVTHCGQYIPLLSAMRQVPDHFRSSLFRYPGILSHWQLGTSHAVIILLCA